MTSIPSFQSRCLLIVLFTCCALLRAQGQPPAADATYRQLETVIRATPAEQMDGAWLSSRVYQPFPKTQTYLKKLMKEPSLAAKSQKMARLRMAANLRALSKVVRDLGITLEITDSGRMRGITSDLDQTVWVIGEVPGGKRPSFEEIERRWKAALQEEGVDPARADMTLFDGDMFLPDVTNAKIGAAEHVATVARNVLEMRQQEGYYVAPGGNREMSQVRPLNEGRTIRLGPAPDQRNVMMNGSLFSIDAFERGEVEIDFRPTREYALRYSDVNTPKPSQNALGNAAENLGQFLTHSTDPVARQKYANRLINQALARVLSCTQASPNGGLTYASVHLDKQLSAEEKGAFKEQFIRQAFGLFLSDAMVREYITLLDTSLAVEHGEGYNAAALYAPWNGEARQKLRASGEDMEPRELEQRVVEESERIYLNKLTPLLVEGAVDVLEHAVREDLTPEGWQRSRSKLGQDAAAVRLSTEKLFAERGIEISLVFEAIEMVDDSSGRMRLRKRLLDAAPYGPLQGMMQGLSDLARAGRTAIDDWLSASARSGRLEAPEKFYTKLDGEVRAITGERTGEEPRLPREEAVAMLAAKIAFAQGVGKARAYESVSQALGEFAREAGRQGLAHGRAYFKEALGNLNFLFFAGAANSLISTYEQSCLKGGLSSSACGDALAWQGAKEFFWNLPLAETYGQMFTGWMDVNEGNAAGFTTVAVGLGQIAGLAAMQAYTVVSLVKGAYDISYGYLEETWRDDLLEQALKAQVTGRAETPTIRCSEATLEQRQLPLYPIFGGPGEIHPESEGWLGEKRMAAARGEFGSSVNLELLAKGFTPQSREWKTERERLLSKYACELPYYHRMAKLYEHLRPTVQRYTAAASRDMADTSVVAIDSCVKVRRDNYERELAAAQGNGPEALTAFHEAQRTKPGALSVCLARGVEEASPLLRPIINREIHAWLKAQPEAYQDNFTTLRERTVGRTFLDDLYAEVEGRFGQVTPDTKAQLLNTLADRLIREYVYSQYSTVKREEVQWEVDRQMAAAAALAEHAQRVLSNIEAGKQRLDGQFREAYASAAESAYRAAESAGPPKVRLLLPGYAVRLGEAAETDALVMGEYRPGDAASAANNWSVNIRRTIQGEASKTQPPDLIVTDALAKELAQDGMGLVSLSATLTAELKDASGNVIARDEGVINYYDVLPKPGAGQETAGREASPGPGESEPSLEEALGQAAAARRNEERAAGEVSDLCNREKQAAAMLEQMLQSGDSLAAQAESERSRLRATLDQLEQLAREAETLADRAIEAAQATGRIRQAIEQNALRVCEGMQRARALTGPRRDAATRELAGGVSLCEMQANDAANQVKTAQEAARRAEALRAQVQRLLQNVERPASLEAIRGALGQNGIGASVRGARMRAERTAQAAAELAEVEKASAAAAAAIDRQRAALQNRPDGLDILANTSAAAGSAQQAAQAARLCVDELQALLAERERQAAAQRERMESAQRELQALQEALAGNTEKGRLEEAASQARAAADTAELFAEAVTQAAADAANCLRMAGEVQTPAPEPTREVPFEDCSRFPGSIAVFAPAPGQAPCVCSPGLEWNTSRTACINCDELGRQALEANRRGDGATAQRLVNEAANCSWYATAVETLRLTGPSSQCMALEQRYYAAMQQGDRGGAQAIRQQAQGCDWTEQAATLENAQECLNLDQQMLQAVQARNPQLAGALLSRMYERNCRVSPTAQNVVQTLLNSPPPPAVDQGAWIRALEGMRRTWEQIMRANRDGGGQPPVDPGRTSGGGVNADPQPVVEAQASVGDIEAFKRQVRERYQTAWYPLWCKKLWSGCGIIPGTARDGLVGLADQAKTQRQLDRAKRMLPCYDSCVVNRATRGDIEAVARDCFNNCKRTVQ